MLFYADPVTFYSTVCGYRTMEYAQTSRWVLMEPAELLFGYASKLVYVGDKGNLAELVKKEQSFENRCF